MILHYELRHMISPTYFVRTKQETVSDFDSLCLVKTAAKKNMFNVSIKTLEQPLWTLVSLLLNLNRFLVIWKTAANAMIIQKIVRIQS